MAFAKAFRPFALIHHLKRTIASLRDQWRNTRRDNERLRKEVEQWRERTERVERERDRLRDENARLKRLVADHTLDKHILSEVLRKKV